MLSVSKKHTLRFWLIAVSVFLLGLTAGGYLVLNSASSRGQLANSTPLAEGKSSDELLDELLKLNQAESSPSAEYVPPENKNLTEEFLKTIIARSGGQNITPEQISSNDFLASTILPYLKSNQPDLFPLIPDSVLNIVPDSRSAQNQYYKDTNAEVVAFYNIMKSTLKLDAEKIADEDVLFELDSQIAELAAAFENLSRVKVPQKLTETHKEVLVSVFSLQKFLEAITQSESDPLKSLLITNDAEALGEFWKQTLYDYTQLPENKRR